MARGRRKAADKVRGKGASPRRGGPRPVAPGDAPKLSEVDTLVAELDSNAGQKRALAAIVLAIDRGGKMSRNQISAQTLKKHCVRDIGAIGRHADVPERLADLEAQLADLKTTIAGKKGSALRASSAVVPPMAGAPPIEGNELRPDMATPPAHPGNGKPYKS